MAIKATFVNNWVSCVNFLNFVSASFMLVLAQSAFQHEDCKSGGYCEWSTEWKMGPKLVCQQIALKSFPYSVVPTVHRVPTTTNIIWSTNSRYWFTRKTHNRQLPHISFACAHFRFFGCALSPCTLCMNICTLFKQKYLFMLCSEEISFYKHLLYLCMHVRYMY